MAATVIGTGLQVGASVSIGTWTNYIVQSVKENDKEIDMEKVMDADGKVTSLVIYGKYPRITVTALLKSAATPSTDFPPGELAALTGLTAYYVESASVDKTKSPHVLTVTLVNYSLS